MVFKPLRGVRRYGCWGMVSREGAVVIDSWNERRILYRDPRFYASFPSTTVRADGVTLVAFRRARDHRWLRGAAYRASPEALHHVDHLDSRSQTMLLALGPDGAPLGEPWGTSPDPQAADQDASLLALRDGRILLAGFCWRPVPADVGQALRESGVGLTGSPQKTGDLYLFWGGYTRFSDDGGLNWSPHAFLPPLPGHPDILPGLRPFHGGAVRGRAVELPDGVLLLTSYTHHPIGGAYASHLFASTDRGERWEHRAVIAHDPDGKAGFCESALHRTTDGRLIAFHRTTGLDDHLATSCSDDDGHSWRPWRRHAVIGHPSDPCPLPDGRLFLCRGYRHKPYGIRARLCDPLGGGQSGDAFERTLEKALETAPEILVRADGVSPDLGYPWASPLPDGRVLVVSYGSDDKGTRGIEANLLSRPFGGG